METGQTTHLVCEQLTGWVDMEAVWYCVGSKSVGQKGKWPATEEKARDQNPYKKSQSDMRSYSEWHAPVM